MSDNGTQQRFDALPAGTQLHGYRLEKILGSGSFGITYLAVHGIFNSRHVIKEFMPENALREGGSTVRPKSEGERELFNWGLARFFDEARLLRSFSHPNVVKVSDVFQANGTAYFVMPWLQGVTLRDWSRHNPRPDKDALLNIFIPLLEGLKYIHGRKILHRDIKPENIYLQAGALPTLIDFGAARQALGVKSKAITQVFTPHFAPIEQYSSQGTYTPALDLYSLGVCIFQAITGHLPPEAPSRVKADAQPRLAGSDFALLYGQNFLAAVDKALALWPEDRFQNGMEFQQALLADEENRAEAAPDSTRNRKKQTRGKGAEREKADRGKNMSPPPLEQADGGKNARSDASGAAGNIASDSATATQGFFGKLLNGDCGLARTYWLYGVLVNIVFYILMTSLPSRIWDLRILRAVLLVHTAYQIAVYIGVWRAAGQYRGRKLWAILAKTAVVLGGFLLLADFVGVFLA
jgi:serine/threonine protein kinase